MKRPVRYCVYIISALFDFTDQPIAEGNSYTEAWENAQPLRIYDQVAVVDTWTGKVVASNRGQAEKLANQIRTKK